MAKVSNVVLVHGGFVDGAGWRGVYDILKKDGFNVSIVQNPTIWSGTPKAALSSPRRGLTRRSQDWCTSLRSPRIRANRSTA